MKAAILENINEPLTIAEVELTDLMVGQVLVKVLVSGICGSQIHEIAGNKGNAKFTPHLLGHEGCGIVEDIGAGVTTVKKGDKVVMHWRKGDGIESDFPRYIFNNKEIKSGKVTTFSEYAIVSENRLTTVPHDTPNELCALLGCGLSTSLGVIDNEIDLKLGESLMVVGVGGLGINLIQAAKLVGAYPIIAVDIHDHKREIALSMGADLFINSRDKDISSAIVEKFDIKKVDVIVDCSGNKSAIESTLGLLSGVGRYVLLGLPNPGDSIDLANVTHMFEGEGKLIKATQGGRFSPAADIPRYVRLHKAGILKLENIITHRIKLDDINDAIDLVRKGLAGRVLIEM